MIASAGLVRSVRAHGWPDGLERFAWDLAREEAERLRLELGLRHTAWKVLLNAEARQTALVVERGYGSAALSLATDFERVYVTVPDPHLATVVAARAAWASCRNLVFADACSIEPDSLDAAVLYGLTEAEITDELLDVLVRALRPRADVYAAIPRSGGGNALARLHRKLGRHFAYVHTYRYRTNGGLGGVYELSSLAGASAGGLREAAARLTAPFRAPAFGILASKTNEVDSVAGRVIAEAERQLGAPIRPLRFLFSNPYGVALVAPPWIIRVPLSAQAADRNRTNYEALCALRSLFPAGNTPDPVLMGSACGQPFSVESVLEGRAAPPHLLEEASAWITRLHRTTAHGCELNQAHLERLVITPMKLARVTLSGDGEREILERLERYLVDALLGERLNLVFSHGDYSLDNILATVNADGVGGVFDWDISQARGLPLLDLLYLFGTAERARTGESIGRIFSRCILPMKWGARPQAALKLYSQALEIPERLFPPLALMSWVHHVAVRTHNPEPYRTTRDATEVAGEAIAEIHEIVSHSLRALKRSGSG